MKDSKLVSLSMALAVDTLKFLESIKGHFALVNQLERAATSVGANIHEANYAQSKADFVSKLRISLKECYETEYWLEVLYKVHSLSEEQYQLTAHKCGTIRRKLIASITTAKNNKQ